MKNLIYTFVAFLGMIPFLSAQSGTTVTATDNGYLFDVNIHTNANGKTFKESVSGARIEVYNNTTNQEVMKLENHNEANFQVALEKGNHYTLMIRKEGFFNKRMEAYVDIEGCILCFDGLENVEPNIVSEVHDHQMSGALVANVGMEKIEMNKVIQIDNIYYDLDKWNIRKDAAKELDKVVNVLNQHPGIIMELGSHTDARGRDEYNLSLSEKRAKEAVAYITSKGIDSKRISARGYGETSLTNKCANGVQCSEKSHQDNRRTELKITGVANAGDVVYTDLVDIIRSNKNGMVVKFKN